MTETGAQTSNLNLPNVLTTLRIVMVPFFGWALLQDGGDSVTWSTRARTSSASSLSVKPSASVPSSSE